MVLFPLQGEGREADRGRPVLNNPRNYDKFAGKQINPDT